VCRFLFDGAEEHEEGVVLGLTLTIKVIYSRHKTNMEKIGQNIDGNELHFLCLKCMIKRQGYAKISGGTGKRGSGPFRTRDEKKCN
jgi:hypothetical protein